MQLAVSACKVCMPLAQINCTRVAASRMQITEICSYLHATGGHQGTICMRLAATRLQDKRQADKRCVKGRLYIIIIFF